MLVVPEILNRRLPENLSRAGGRSADDDAGDGDGRHDVRHD
jgi:hypothetical protein